MKLREAKFTPDALEELQGWTKDNSRLAGKIIDLISECAKTPFEGKGKPEPLKGNYSGYWSRRINDEHRLIYKVDDNFVTVFSCKGHYD